jgi:hypothetical protein
MSLAALEAKAGLIAYWDFNDTNLGVDRGAGTLTTTFPSGDIDAWYGGTTKNALSGVLAEEALTVENSANNGVGHLTFAIDTSNYYDINLSFATRRSDKGFQSNTVSYSTNAGSSFTNLSSTNPPNPYNPTTSTAFEVLTFDFSAIEGLDLNANAVFRITFDGARDPAGNNRLDNIQFTGTAVPEPSTFALASLASLGWGVYALRSRRRSLRVAQLRERSHPETFQDITGTLISTDSR